ncbi:MAG TPA: hypothetical protein VGW10_02855 [Solirubrobacteraceae bacterium]|nr:hypothetical protein [Solirubrobacteraceae bacterium]
MNTLALIRPTEWEIPLFFHVLGAMVMVGATLLALTALAGAWRNDDAAALGLGYRALLLGALPGWLVMRVFAQITLDKSPYEDDAGWIEIGFITSEPTLLLLIAATVLARLSWKRAEGGTRVRVAVALVALLLVADAIAIWAMTTKPD